ncbi:MAG: tetratricopeptide repeat protein, partial [Kofleriaceae bacterium]
MLARAHAALHQWKEAQGELLRVVKIDRSNRQGFALLGEVLLRRQDYERAVPVLQHAQNLDPTSPQILSMLKRARAGQALDPPPPLPSPIPPRGETNQPAEIQRSRSAPMATPPRRSPQNQVPTASPQMRTMAIEPAPELATATRTQAAPPSSFPDASAGFSVPSASSSRAPKQTAPPPMS